LKGAKGKILLKFSLCLIVELMKEILAKQHNLLFLAASVIFAQFIASIVFSYMQVMTLSPAVIEAAFYIYMIYCVAVCVICAIFVIRKAEFQYARLWFSCLFLYIFCELLFFAKLFLTAYRDIPGFSLWEPNFDRSATIYNLNDSQPFFRLFLCLALVFAIYAFSYIAEKKRASLIFAAVNIFAVSLIVIFMPVSFYIASDYALDILAFSASREAALTVIFANLIAAACYAWYTDDK